MGLNTTILGDNWPYCNVCACAGCVHIPVRPSARMLVGFWWLYAIILAASYSANLMALIAVSKPCPPFQTFAELAEQDEYKFGVMGGGSLPHLLEVQL